MSWLWALLPDEFMVVVIIGVGLALMVGLIAGRRAWQILGTIFLVLLGPVCRSSCRLVALVASASWSCGTGLCESPSVCLSIHIAFLS